MCFKIVQSVACPHGVSVGVCQGGHNGAPAEVYHFVRFALPVGACPPTRRARLEPQSPRREISRTC